MFRRLQLQVRSAHHARSWNSLAKLAVDVGGAADLSLDVSPTTAPLLLESADSISPRGDEPGMQLHERAPASSTCSLTTLVRLLGPTGR